MNKYVADERGVIRKLSDNQKIQGLYDNLNSMKYTLKYMPRYYKILNKLHHD